MAIKVSNVILRCQKNKAIKTRSSKPNPAQDKNIHVYLQRKLHYSDNFSGAFSGLLTCPFNIIFRDNTIRKLEGVHKNCGTFL